MGTSLVVIARNAGAALAARIGTATVAWGSTLPFAAAAIAGVLTGGQLAGRLDAACSLRWFAALLIAVSA